MHWIPQLFVLFAFDFTFLFEVNPIRELISQWGQWDLNLASRWGQFINAKLPFIINEIEIISFQILDSTNLPTKD
jgi:hypothetical protein